MNVGALCQRSTGHGQERSKLTLDAVFLFYFCYIASYFEVLQDMSLCSACYCSDNPAWLVRYGLYEHSFQHDRNLMAVMDNFDESSLSMEILIWASSRWLKTVIRLINSVIWGHYKPVSYQLKVDFRG